MIARGSDHEGQSFLFLFALTKEIVKNLCFRFFMAPIYWQMKTNIVLYILYCCSSRTAICFVLRIGRESCGERVLWFRSCSMGGVELQENRMPAVEHRYNS